MENREGLEREISLKEIFWNLLFGWRRIICFAVVFCILFCAFRYIRDMEGYHAEQELSKSEENSLSGEERTEVENIIKLRNLLSKDQEYLNTSPYMQMDPYSVHVLEMEYYVKSNYVMNYTKDVLPDYTADLDIMYFRYIGSGEMRESLIESAGLSVNSQEFAEMVDVKQSYNEFFITIKYAEEDKLSDISDVLKELLSQKEKEFQQIGSHSLMLIGENQSTIVDDKAIDKRNSIFTRMSTISVQINQLKSVLSAQQKKALNEELNVGEEVELVRPQPSKKYFILGGVVGIFLAAIWIVCMVLFTEKLQNPEEIRSLYGMHLLGEINVQSRKKRFLSIIDDKLMLLKNRRRKHLTVEQQINVTCTNIAISCREQGTNSIYLTGSEYEHADAALIEMMKKKLKEQGIQVKEGGNIYYDAASMEQGKEIGNILLVEQVGKSVYDEISNEIQLITEQNSKILGIVVLV